MSVVRKYQSGNSIPIQKDVGNLESYLAEYVNSNTFTKKATPLAQQSAKALVELHNSGVLDKALKFDPISQKYSVDLNQIPEDKQQYFIGSPDVKTKSKLFGSIKHDQPSINEALISEYYKFKGTNTTPELPKNANSGITRTPVDLESYVDTKYNSNWGEAIKDKKQEEIESMVMQLMAENIEGYNKEHQLNITKPENERDIYKPIDFSNLSKAIASGNYKLAADEAFKVGWNPNSLLKSEDQLQYDAAKLEEKAALEEKETTTPIQEDVPAVLPKEEVEEKPAISTKLPIIDTFNRSTFPKYRPITVSDQDKVATLNTIEEESLKALTPGYDVQMDPARVGQLLYMLDNPTGLDQDQIDKIKVLLSTIQTSQKLKEGGIIKAQAGTILTAKQLEEKLKSAKLKVAKNTTARNLIAGPFTAEKALSIASVAGDAGSFIPGYGAIGGLVTTGADIAKDILKDGFQASDIFNANTAANLGFTALSLVGFGGLKALIKTAKVANVADKVIDVTKLAKEADVSQDILKLASSIPNATPKKLGTVIENLEKDSEIVKKMIGGSATAEQVGALKKSLTTDVSKVVEHSLKETRLGKVQNLVEKGANTGYGKFMALSAMTAPSFDAVTNAGSAIISGNAGNISLEDVGKIGQAGIIGRSFFNKSLKGAINRQTEEVPAKSILSFTSKSGEKRIIEVGELPKKLSRYKNMPGTVSKDFNEKLLKQVGETEGEIKVLAKVPKSFKMKEAPSGTNVEKAKKEFEMLQKRLGISPEKVTKVASPEVKVMESKVPEVKATEIKPAEAIKIEPIKAPSVQAPKKVLSKSSSMVKRQSKDVTTLKERYEFLNKNKVGMKRLLSEKKGIKKHEDGGILKFQGGGGFWEKLFTQLGNSKTTPGPYVAQNWISNKPIVKPVIKKAVQPFTINADVPIIKEAPIKQYTPVVLPEQPVIEEPINVTDEPIIPKADQSILPEKNTTGDLINSDKKSFLSKLKVSPYQENKIANALLLANSLRASNKYSRLADQALVEQAGGTKGMLSTPYSRINAKNVLFAEDQATKARTRASNVAGSITDIDKGMAYKLATERNIGDTMTKAKAADEQTIVGGINRQADAVAKVNQYNLGATDYNKALMASIFSKIKQNAMNKTSQDSTIMQQYLQNAMEGRLAKKREDKAQEYVNIINSPELQNLKKSYEDLANQEIIARQNFEKLKEGKNTVGTGEWEDTAEGKAFKAKKEALGKSAELLSQKRTSAQLAMQYGTPLKAKGGTLEEKIYLEKLKNSGKAEIEHNKEFYKRMMKDKELMLKSLLKIFK